MTAKARVPSEDLEAGRVDEALAAYRKLKEANPSDPAVAEQRFNNVGYRLITQKEYPKAIAILQLNTELYPASWNTYDSLAEAYMGERRQGEGDRVLPQVDAGDRRGCEGDPGAEDGDEGERDREAQGARRDALAAC